MGDALKEPPDKARGSLAIIEIYWPPGAPERQIPLVLIWTDQPEGLVASALPIGPPARAQIVAVARRVLIDHKKRHKIHEKDAEKYCKLGVTVARRISGARRLSEAYKAEHKKRRESGEWPGDFQDLKDLEESTRKTIEED